MVRMGEKAMSDDPKTNPVPCGACKRIPRYWNWCDGGAHITCDCGVSGPAVADAEGFDDCVPAWNRMWDTSKPATRKVLERAAWFLGSARRNGFLNLKIIFFHSRPDDCEYYELFQDLEDMCRENGIQVPR